MNRIFSNPRYFETPIDKAIYEYDEGDRRLISKQINKLSSNNINSMTLKPAKKNYKNVPINSDVNMKKNPVESNYVNGKDDKKINVEKGVAQTPESKQISQPAPAQTPVPVVPPPERITPISDGIGLTNPVTHLRQKNMSYPEDEFKSNTMNYILIAGGILIIAILLNKK